MDRIDRAANRADPEPSDAQKAAGNYRKGHTILHGLDITIENAKGSVRSGKDGKKWTVVMPAHYGYIKRTEGADGDHVDVYIGPSPASDRVFLVDQVDAETGHFDEHKALLGFVAKQQAVSAYQRAFSDGKGPDRMGHVTVLSIGAFKRWLAGDTTKPRHKLIPHFEDGGAMPEDDDEPDQNQSTGSVPSFDDWVAQQQQAPSAPAQPQGKPSFDDWIAQQGDQQPDQADQGDKPQLSALQSAGVGAARSTLPALGGLAAAGPGFAIGAAIGGPLAPVTGLAGAVGGAILGGKVVNQVQDWVLSKLGLLNTADEYSQAAEEQHPIASFAGSLVPAFAGSAPVKGAQLLARGFSAAAQGGLEAGQEWGQGDDIDPTKIALAAGAGAVLPGQNRLGNALGHTTPGRPDVKEDPAVIQDKVDASASEPLKVGTGTAVAQPAPVTPTNPVGAGIGERSERDYKKANPDGSKTGAPAYTEGDDPAIMSTFYTDQEAAAADQGTKGPQSLSDVQQALGVKAPEQPAQAMGNAKAGEPPPQVGNTGLVEAAQARNAARNSDLGAEPGEVNAPNSDAPNSVTQPGTAPPDTVSADHPALPDVQIIRNRRVPWLAGSSLDRNTVYLNPNVPERMNINGKIIDPAQPLAVHEIAERTAIDKIKENIASGAHAPMGMGKIYDVAHEHGGTMAERRYLMEQHGFNEADFNEYQKQMRALVPAAEHEMLHAGDVPHDLYTEMYPHEESMHLHSDAGTEEAGPTVDQDAAQAAKDADIKQRTLDMMKGQITGVSDAELSRHVDQAAAEKNGRVLPDLTQEKPAEPVAADHGAPQSLDDIQRQLNNPAAAAAPKEDTRTQRGERHVVPENGTTAGSKAEADRRSRSFQAAKAAYDKFAPEKTGELPTTPEQIKAYRDRLQGAIDHSKVAFDQLYSNAGEAPLATKHPLHYTPRRDTSTAALNWLRDSRAYLNGKLEGGLAAHVANEALYRGGNAEDAKLARDTGGIQAGIKKSRRSGDDAVTTAEEALAKRDEFPTEYPGEDIPASDLKADDQGAGPHIDEIVPEDADLTHATPAQLDEISNKLLGVKEREVDPDRVAQPEPEPEAQEVRRPKVSDEEKAALVAKFNAMQEAATRRKGVADFLRDTGGGGKAPVGSPQWVQNLNKWLTSSAPRVYSIKTPPNAVTAKLKAVTKAMPGEQKFPWVHQPTKEERFGFEQQEKLDKLTKEGHIDRNTLGQEAEKLPALAKTPKVQADVYHAMEHDAVAQLPAAVQTAIKPLLDMRDEVKQIYANLKKWDPTLPPLDPQFMHRVLGNTLDKPADSDPLSIIKRSLRTTQDSLQDRTFMALERQDGKRFVVSPAESQGKQGFSVWLNHKSGFVQENTPLKAGESFTQGKDTFKVVNAKTAEVEAHANFKDGSPATYLKNAYVSLAKQLIDMREAQRNVQYIESLKSNNFMDRYGVVHATKDTRAIPEGWEKSNLPQFSKPGDTWYMDPPTKAVFDDYVKPGFEDSALDPLRRLNTNIVKTMFWNPVPHAMNVAVHWAVGRGWDWLTPQGLHDATVGMAKSYMSVMRNDAHQMEIARNGGATILQGIRAGDFSDTMGKTFSIAIQRDKPAWDLIAKTIGVGPSDVGRMVYAGAQRSMWFANDVLYTNMVDSYQRKGYSMRDAVVMTDKHMPNYRVPAKILGSRFASKFMQDNVTTLFGRYHVGLINSLGHMANDLVGPDATAKQRFDALGNVIALGMFAYLVKPQLDALAQVVTGNKDAKTNNRGPMSIISAAQDLITKGNVSGLIGTSLSLTPGLKMFTEGGVNNRVGLTGKNILEPGDVAGMFPHKTDAHTLTRSAKAAGRVGSQAADYVGQQYQPVQLAETALRNGRSLPRAVATSLADIKEPSQGSINYEHNYKGLNEKNANQRYKKPPGELEKAYNKEIGK